jgi:uncharacterized RDD family membrane protein YckC
MPAGRNGTSAFTAAVCYVRIEAMERVSRQHLLLRFGAFLLDALLIALILILPGALASWIIIVAGGELSWLARIWNVVFLLFLLGLLLRDGWRGRSLGKLIMGLTLGPRQGRLPGYGHSLLRNISLLIPGVNLIEILLVLFSAGGRRIGDRLAGTTVVEE